MSFDPLVWPDRNWKSIRCIIKLIASVVTCAHSSVIVFVNSTSKTAKSWSATEGIKEDEQAGATTLSNF